MTQEMRSYDDVMQKIHILRKRYYAELKKERLEVKPENCKYNTKVRVRDHGKFLCCKNEEFCNLNKGWPIVVCENFCTCEEKYYEALYDEESVEKEFTGIISDPSKCGEIYPKLSMLLWFVQGSIKKDEGGMLIKIWKRICFWRKR